MEGYFGLLAGIISIAGYLPYIRDIWQARARPDRASWIIWAVEYTLLFIAQLAAGATHSLWLIGLQTLCVLVVCSLSLLRGSGGLTRSNIAALAVAGVGLLGWYFTRNPGVAIILLLLVETVGVILTIRKTYHDPTSETLPMWVCAGTAGIFGVLAVGSAATWSLYLYPISLSLMCFGVVAVVVARRQSVRTSQIDDEVIPEGAEA